MKHIYFNSDAFWNKIERSCTLYVQSHKKWKNRQFEKSFGTT